jgi:hypothetical protein
MPHRKKKFLMKILDEANISKFFLREEFYAV